MSPCLTDSAIAEFVQGLSTPAEAQAIEAHVAGCSNCRQLLSRTSALLLSLPGGAPRSQSITNALRARPAPRRRARALALALALLVLVLAVAVAGGVWLGRARQPAAGAQPSLGGPRH